jgi:predicted 3-demethylubiquinone-9 3-methyltransferase (glyoxalase superfamily)
VIGRPYPCLWFNMQAEEAAQLYTSVFPNSRILEIARYPDAMPDKAGQVLTITFELNGERFMALNGGPEFTFNESVSFVVDCDSQAEVDDLWERLTEGGAESMCGWLKDRFGVSWQIVPRALGEMMADKDPSKVNRVTLAMLQMRKLDIATLRQAYEQA